MAQIMSTVMIVFMIVPVLAPGFGQLILAVSDWRMTFFSLAIYGAALALWAAFRLPETLAVQDRRPLSLGGISEAVWTTLRIRQSIGNTVAQTLLMGALFSFINSVQQIVFDVFKRPELFGIMFACIAGPMALSSWLNSRLVMRLGSRRILMVGLVAFTTAAVTHLLIASMFGESIWVFAFLQAATMIFFGLIGANSGALAMEPLGHIAGTASSVQGVITTIGGALLGFLVGQQFDGTTLPFLTGSALCGGAALAAAWWANARPAEDTHDRGLVEAQESKARPG
jgi:DHA1 family bicyclomycin/chloramphenicol resistance-like MFS transporter